MEPAPLTTREEELQEIKKAEINTDYNVDSRHQTLSGVGFPITSSAKDAIQDMVRGSHGYLRFRIGRKNLLLCQAVFIEHLSSL